MFDFLRQAISDLSYKNANQNTGILRARIDALPTNEEIARLERKLNILLVEDGWRPMAFLDDGRPIHMKEDE